ncbi:Fpg/Nei family DNA glycosylase [Propionibacteriaceae bacterium G1746]|uniref:Fpg/Nei family DNA glycosylase n=1 Tax=Aestuariimicrobium sp. G57 TaxID=3418485 RepID=UPI003C25AF46
MPEMPEVEALRRFLADKLVDKAIISTQLVAFSALKTVLPPLDALHGMPISGVSRHGKFLDIDAQGVHMVFHLARAGWLVWRDEMPDKPLKLGKGPMALRVRLSDGSGFDLTEAGTQKHLAVHVVTDPDQIDMVATLGPDPTDELFTADDFDALLTRSGRAQVKGVLKDQRVLAGIGNAYSDEILHVAKLSPFLPVSSLSRPQRDDLLDTIRTVLAEAVDATEGLGAESLKDSKRAGLRVHGRTGKPCPVCGTTIAEVSFADSSLQYCPGCQTGGKPLADRRMSKLLK